MGVPPETSTNRTVRGLVRSTCASASVDNARVRSVRLRSQPVRAIAAMTSTFLVVVHVTSPARDEHETRLALRDERDDVLDVERARGRPRALRYTVAFADVTTTRVPCASDILTTRSRNSSFSDVSAATSRTSTRAGCVSVASRLSSSTTRLTTDAKSPSPSRRARHPRPVRVPRQAEHRSALRARLPDAPARLVAQPHGVKTPSREGVPGRRPRDGRDGVIPARRLKQESTVFVPHLVLAVFAAAHDGAVQRGPIARQYHPVVRLPLDRLTSGREGFDVEVFAHP